MLLCGGICNLIKTKNIWPWKYISVRYCEVFLLPTYRHLIIFHLHADKYNYHYRNFVGVILWHYIHIIWKTRGLNKINNKLKTVFSIKHEKLIVAFHLYDLYVHIQWSLGKVIFTIFFFLFCYTTTNGLTIQKTLFHFVFWHFFFLPE